MKKHVTFVQPYLPAYRVPLFRALSELLAEDGLVLRVAHSSPSGEQAARSDARREQWSVDLPLHSLRIGGTSLKWRPSWRLLTDSAVIVAELASTNIDTYLLAAQRKVPFVVWGHGRAFVTKAHWLDDMLELALAKRAHHVMAYTIDGAASLEARGVPPERVTVVYNSTDTTSLRTEMQKISEEEVGNFRRQLGVDGKRIGVFIGALDESKSLDLLLDASALIFDHDPNFRLVIAGDGTLRKYVEYRASSQTEVVLLPRIDTHNLALVGAIATVCLMPGRVGLVAVDTLTLGLPLVTTDWPYHAPEISYLSPSDLTVTERNPSAYALGVETILNRRPSQTLANRSLVQPPLRYSIEHMADNMAKAIRAVGT